MSYGGDKPGTYHGLCTFHSHEMHRTVIVA